MHVPFGTAAVEVTASKLTMVAAMAVAVVKLWRISESAGA
jgi:hypothetical protein